MRWIAILMALIAPCPVLADGCGSLADLRWLLGGWSADGEHTAFHESWTESTTQTFEGVGIERSKPGGTVKGEEALRLVEMAGGLFYVSKVTHNELPIAFRLTGCDGGMYVFENPAHDFPRRLEYRRVGEDRVVVRVSDGGEKGFTLDFRRETAAVPGSTAAVLAAEDARFAAMIAANPDEMRRRFTADLLYTHSNGRVENREQLIDTIVSGRMQYIEVQPAEREVGFTSASTAIVRGRGSFRVKAGEAPLDLRLRYLAIYVLNGGSWQLRDWQSLREP
jgi:hypothetical protein